MSRLRTWLTRHLIADGPADAGYLDILDGRVRECRSDAPIDDDLCVEHRAEIEAMTYALDIPRPHEGTAAERTGGAA